MNQEAIHYIMQRMSGWLDNRQMVVLQNTLDESVKLTGGREAEKTTAELLDAFIGTKRLEGRSEGTIELYLYNIRTVLNYSEKNACVMTTDDIRQCLVRYQEEHKIGKVTLDNARRNLSSFFRWLEDENYIFKSPLRRIRKIKTTTTVLETYADEDLEKLRDDCKEMRNLAIIDMLNSTGMRVGELVKLDRADVDFEERECIVLGKGDKERLVYFDAKTKLHLKKYLNARTDENPALFVSIRHPHNRLLSSGVELMLRKMGEQSCVNHVHPHKFRRTMATAAIDKGMPIEQVQRLLGHEKIDTTLHYAMVKQNNVKLSHKKYIG